MSAYTFTSLIGRVKLKGLVSKASALSETDLLNLASDSFRSYVVPFCKSVRDEWFVAPDDYEATTVNGRILLPDSVASTIRTVAYRLSGLDVPLTRIEPENAFMYQQASSLPVGFMLRGYRLVLLPVQTASFDVRISYMRRPADACLEQDAGLIESHSGLDLTLESVPLAWQEEAPTSVDVISSASPFLPVAEEVACTLAGDVLTLSGIDSGLIEDGFWVSDVGTNPFPEIPIELHPLLELDVVCTLYQAAGDKRLEGALRKQDAMEKALLKTMAPRAQGSSRVITNPNAPGMGGGWRSGFGVYRP